MPNQPAQTRAHRYFERVLQTARGLVPCAAVMVSTGVSLTVGRRTPLRSFVPMRAPPPPASDPLALLLTRLVLGDLQMLSVASAMTRKYAGVSACSA
jgi:hypothetical protein